MAHNCNSLTFSTKNGVIPIDDTCTDTDSNQYTSVRDFSNILPY